MVTNDHAGLLFEENGADAIAVVGQHEDGSRASELPSELSRASLTSAPRWSQRHALDVGDDMVLEYVAFRGFTETFRIFSMERLDDARRRGSFDAKFAVEALLRPARELDVSGLIEAWDFVESKFLVQLDAELTAHAEALRCGLFRFFCTTSVMRGEPTKAIELLTSLARRDAEDARGRRPRGARAPHRDEDERAMWALSDDEEDCENGRDRDAGDDDDPRDVYRSRGRNGAKWREWFAMPHLPEPHKDPVFRLYFTRRWQDDFKISLHNFLATVFARAPPPKLLLLEKWHRTAAQKAIRSALADSKRECLQLRQALDQAAASRDALAKTVKVLIAHCHHESLRDSSKLRRGGLFDEDPQDALRLAREAGATALELAKRCDDPNLAAAIKTAPEPDSRDAMLISLCDATKVYLDLLRGSPALTSHSSTPNP